MDRERKYVGDMSNDNNVNENFGLDTPLYEYYENIENGDYSASDKYGKNNIFINNLHLHTDSGYSKVVSAEELNEKEKKKFITKKRAIFGGIGGLLFVLAFAGCWNHDKIASYIQEKMNKEPKANNENSINDEQNHDAALANSGVIVDEEVEQTQDVQDAQEVQQVQETQEVEQSEPIGEYDEEAPIDEVVGDRILAFTDANDDEQVLARAHAINCYFQASNVMDITDEELCDQIKFINGTYNAATDDEAYDVYNACLETFSTYSFAIVQNVKFAGGLVDDNGVHEVLGLDAFLTDNCEHRALMDEVSEAFIAVIKASTTEKKANTSKILLKLEADLMEGQKETPNGTKIYYENLNDSEGFITGIMFQIGNDACTSALGQDVKISYKDNIGEDVIVPLNKLNEYYYGSPCDGEDWVRTIWDKDSYNLIETAIGKGYTFTPRR